VRHHVVRYIHALNPTSSLLRQSPRARRASSGNFLAVHVSHKRAVRVHHHLLSDGVVFDGAVFAACSTNARGAGMEMACEGVVISHEVLAPELGALFAGVVISHEVLAPELGALTAIVADAMAKPHMRFSARLSLHPSPPSARHPPK
jgi:hypothetical protein